MKIAEQLIRRFGGETLDETCENAIEELFPHIHNLSGHTPLAGICNQYGLRVRMTEDAPFLGRIEWIDDETAEITIRRTRNPRNDRFTLAHELGHWVIQTQLPVRRETLFRGIAITTKETEEEELFADLFATELLLPRKKFLDSELPCVRGLMELEREYVVSGPTLLRRFANVLKRTVVHGKVIPARFGDENSRAVLDMLYVAEPGEPPYQMCDDIRFAEPIIFNELEQRSDRKLELVAENSELNVLAAVDGFWSVIPRWEFLGLVDD